MLASSGLGFRSRKREKEMSSKVANISDLIQCVASSCFPIVNSARAHRTIHTIGDAIEEEDDDEEDEEKPLEEEDDDDDDDESLVKTWGEEEGGGDNGVVRGGEEEEASDRMKEMEGFINEMFEAVSGVKRAYVSLQESHCPWDPEKMRVADAAVVAELRKLGRLRDRFRRGGGGGAWDPPPSPPPPPPFQLCHLGRWWLLTKRRSMISRRNSN